MDILISQFPQRAHFESVRDSLLAYGIDISSLKVVGSYSDTAATPNESSVLATVTDLYEGFPDSEGQLRMYAENVVKGGAIMRIEFSDERQADLAVNLVQEFYINPL